MKKMEMQTNLVSQNQIRKRTGYSSDSNLKVALQIFGYKDCQKAVGSCYNATLQIGKLEVCLAWFDCSINIANVNIVCTSLSMWWPIWWLISDASVSFIKKLNETFMNHHHESSSLRESVTLSLSYKQKFS